MYTLLSGLHQYLTQKDEFNVIILGLDNAGKTTLLDTIKSIFLKTAQTHPSKIAPTVGLNIGRIDFGSKKLHFWDLGGQADLHSIWDKYYSESHAILFVIDGTEKERIPFCRETFEKMICNDEVEGIPVLICINKQDKEGSMRVEEVKELFNPVAPLIGARDSKVQALSALTGEGVREAVDWLLIRIERNRIHRPPIEK